MLAKFTMDEYDSGYCTSTNNVLIKAVYGDFNMF